MKWIAEVDKKYNNRFINLIPTDIHYKSGDYAPAVEHIWLEIDGLPTHIVWEKALKTNKIDLPKIGDKIITDTGHISGQGPKIFGGTENDYFTYEDFEHKDLDLPKDEHGHVKEYSKIEGIVSDIKISPHHTYKREKYKYDRATDSDNLISSYLLYFEFISFQYCILCKYAPDSVDKFIVTSRYGFDPQFYSKYHYANYSTNDT